MEVARIESRVLSPPQADFSLLQRGNAFPRVRGCTVTVNSAGANRNHHYVYNCVYLKAGNDKRTIEFTIVRDLWDGYGTSSSPHQSVSISDPGPWLGRLQRQRRAHRRFRHRLEYQRSQFPFRERQTLFPATVLDPCSYETGYLSGLAASGSEGKAR